MKTRFGLVFDERDDGVKVWSAECQGCGTMIVGELSPQVVVVQTAEPMPTAQFEQLKAVIGKAWDYAKRSGYPILNGVPGVKIESTIDHGDLQRALEAHAECCGRPRPAAA